MYVKNLNGEEFPCQVNVQQEYELNSNIKLSTTILPSKVNLSFIHEIEQMWSIFDFEEVEHKIIYAKRKGKGKLMTVDIKAIPLFFDVLDNQRIYDDINAHMTPQVAFTHIFEDTGFNFILVDSFYAVDWEGFGAGESKLETFKRALNRYKAEFEIVGNTVHLKALIGRDTQFQYRHRLNASNIVQEIDANEYWTYAKGYGDYKDGEADDDGGWQNANLTREYTSPLANISGIGKRDAPPLKNGNITTIPTMDESLKTLVDESLKVSVSADVHDLRKQNYPMAQPQLGDSSYLIDERIDYDEKVRIVNIKISRNWRNEVTGLVVVFGSQGLAKSYQSKLNTATKNITDVFNERKKLPFGAYDAAVQQATRDLKNARSELTFPEVGGILTIDKDDPNEVTLLNSKGFGVSDNGGALFKTAITGRGVFAETLIGKILIGQNLLIENEDSTFLVDKNGVNIAGAALSIVGGLTDSNITSADKWNGQGTYIDDNGVYTGSLTTSQITVGKFPDTRISSADKWNGQGTFIDSTGVYTGQLTANQIKSGVFDDDLIASASKWNTQGTLIDGNGVYTGSLNAMQIQLGFNKIGNNVRIIPDGMETYSGAKKTSRLYEDGHEFFSGEKRVGKIGTSGPQSTLMGLAIALDEDGGDFYLGKEDRNFGPIGIEPKMVWSDSPSYNSLRGFAFYDEMKIFGDVAIDYRSKLNVEGEMYAIRGFFGPKASVRSTQGQSRLYFDESTYLFLNSAGGVGVVHNGVTKYILLP